MSQVTLIVNGQKVHGNRHEPILVQLEKAGFKPEYQCRNGVCGACRCTLKNGKIKHHNVMAFIGPNEVLSCSATPLTDINIEFVYQIEKSQMEES